MRTALRSESLSQLLMPLVRSIGCELTERLDAVNRLEEHMVSLAMTREDSSKYRLLAAEAATHNRAISQARVELELLGCSIVGEDPVTLRIRPEDGARKYSFLWQMGHG